GISSYMTYSNLLEHYPSPVFVPVDRSGVSLGPLYDSISCYYVNYLDAQKKLFLKMEMNQHFKTGEVPFISSSQLWIEPVSATGSKLYHLPINMLPWGWF